MIQKMEKLVLLIHHKEYREFLEELRRLGVVHVEMNQQAGADKELLEFMQKRAAYQSLQKNLSVAAAACQEAFSEQPERMTIEQVAGQYDLYQHQLRTLHIKSQEVDKEISDLEVWGDFDWHSIDKLAEYGWKTQFFACPEKSFDEEWTEACNATPINTRSGQLYFLTVNTRLVELPATSVDLPHKSLSSLRAEMRTLQQEAKVLTDAFNSFCKAHLPQVEKAIRHLENDINLMEVDQFGGERVAGGAVVVMDGWVPAENAAEVRRMLDAKGVFYEMRPAEKEENAPIKLKNGRISRLFEMLTRMYGMPDYGEFDPTPLFAPFYALFFGMCVGDAGYGLFIIALGFYLKSKLGKSMAGLLNLLITLGAATTIVGALFNTFFGFALTDFHLPEWMSSLLITGKWDGTAYDKTMVLALLVGMFHICFAMTVKSVCTTARYGFKNALSDWGWWLLVCGSVVVATLNYLGVIDFEMSKLAFIAIGGVSAIGIYLLNNLRRNVFVNVGAGLWDTYNMATGLMGDLLSYLRLYALGLAGGMLGGVFNDLGLQLKDSMDGMLFGIPGWICCGLIFVAGHTLNIALSCLSGYVHSIRLTFVEYFKNSGYDGRGVAYNPFAEKKEEE